MPAPAHPLGRGVLIFAHVPPPHHGQSVMVQYTLDLLRTPPAGNPPLRVFHIDARVSRDIADVGATRPTKLLSLALFCLRAVGLRVRHGIEVFYYVPASPARAPMMRDWIVMALCRWAFPRVVFHWHAGGLSGWLRDKASPWERALTRWLLGRHHLSIVLRPYHRRDAEYLAARNILVLPNAVPDPCPDFETTLRSRRQAAAAARQAASASPAGSPAHTVRLLYLSLVRREKGIFELLEAVARANASLQGRPVRFELTVAGEFASPADRQRFEERVRQADLAGPAPAVRYVGFAAGSAKDRLLRESECLCFPTLLPEGFPLTLAEAMAYGLPLVVSNHLDLPEVLPPGYPGVFAAGNAGDLARRLIEFLSREDDPRLRAWYLDNLSPAPFLHRLREALSTV